MSGPLTQDGDSLTPRSRFARRVFFAITLGLIGFAMTHKMFVANWPSPAVDKSLFGATLALACVAISMMPPRKSRPTMERAFFRLVLAAGIFALWGAGLLWFGQTNGLYPLAGGCAFLFAAVLVRARILVL